jgi:hypothetical protein
MTGDNELRLNEATIIAAVQEYFNKRTDLSGRFKVTHVAEMPGPQPVFKVSVTDPDILPPSGSRASGFAKG